MGRLGSYSIGILCSLVLHVGLGAFIVTNWEPEQKRQIVAPKYIDARLLELREKSRPKEKKPGQAGSDAARKKAEAERRRREAEKRRRAEARKRPKRENAAKPRPKKRLKRKSAAKPRPKKRLKRKSAAVKRR